MFAINHAATALVIKKRWPEAPLAWLLVSVQLVELLWVALNYLGIERTETEAVVRSVHDIHLAYMPWSHSIGTSALLAAVAWLYVAKILHRPRIAFALAVGILSHIMLDLLTHTRDVAIVPFYDGARFGLGLYDAPLAALFVETGYGLLCWWWYGGGRALLATILLFNLANLSFFSAVVPGPESLLAGHPLWLVTAVALQIVVTLVLVGAFSVSRRHTGKVATSG